MSSLGRTAGVFALAVAVGVFSQMARASEASVAAQLQDVSVTVVCKTTDSFGMPETRTGSGVLRTLQIDGKSVTFVWTAAHVVVKLRKAEEAIDPVTGQKKTVVRYDDARITTEIHEGGRRVGEGSLDAKVVRVGYDDDIALLRVRKTNYTKASAKVYMGADPPAIGTKVLHVGSLMGQYGANSMTSGIQSQIGRVLEDGKEYDQITASSFPGSSGGGVFTEDGRYLGMVTRGVGETFTLIVPIRRMLRWADKAGVRWALDDSVRPPTEADLEKLPIDDGSPKPGTGAHTLRIERPASLSRFLEG